MNKKTLCKKEIIRRKKKYWDPYHNQLREEIARLKEKHGYCILYDAHSIASKIPNLFLGQLPDLNFGTNRGKSCNTDLQEKIHKIIKQSSYSFAINERFIGGYITRNYGDPKNNIHAMQMEISQKNYMNEGESYQFLEHKADKLRPLLRNTLETIINWNPLDRKKNYSKDYMLP